MRPLASNGLVTLDGKVLEREKRDAAVMAFIALFVTFLSKKALGIGIHSLSSYFAFN